MIASKFLVIRRDNIGDLVCTTPLISALRQHFPTARIDALVNSYIRPVVEHNPDLDHVYNYTKAKHRAENISVLRVYFDRIKLMWQLRRTNYEYVILANASCLPRPIHLAQQVNPKRVIGFVEPDAPGSGYIDLPVALDRANPAHECETLFKLLQPLGIKGTPPPMKVEAMPEEVARVKAQLDGLGWRAEEQIIGIHVSARQISQRWPADHFVALIKLLHQRYRAKFMLFWSPGDEQNPHHPGDDQKANAILQGAAGLP
ncbi:MAG: glycosyltransferase family 9 protein, partial [Sulfuricella sp.]|nr:glycosyltransferase family 9 protein [Sulfuricella sp.]